MSDKQHTPEPWKHVGQGDIIGANNDDTCAAYLRADIGDANARRIVACVNACAGIPTDVLEDKSILKADDDLRIKREELEKQRDELLALIKNDAFAMSFQSLGQYRTALIASVKGGAV